jgi:hypothetical protein
VAGSKALHHLLPELVLPIDRTYTAPFLFRTEPRDFQERDPQAETFPIAFETAQKIASRIDLAAL